MTLGAAVGIAVGIVALLSSLVGATVGIWRAAEATGELVATIQVLSRQIVTLTAALEAQDARLDEHSKEIAVLQNTIQERRTAH